MENENRQVIISRIIKLKALGKSERQLGNKGAADTIDDKVKLLITKYSIVEGELGDIPKAAPFKYTNPNPNKEYPYSSHSPSDLEEAMREMEELLGKMMQDKNRPHSTQKEYRYTSSFKLPHISIPPTDFVNHMCRKFHVRKEKFEYNLIFGRKVIIKFPFL